METELRQFICITCPGKFSWHLIRVWYERVPVDKDGTPGTSKCYVCNKQTAPVPRGEELYVHICHFSCSSGHPLREFTVRCKMSDTAPCYACIENSEIDSCDAQVSPHSFSALRRIKRCTDNVHNCSECNGGPNCPNMNPQPEEGGPIPPSLLSPVPKEVVKQSGSTASSRCG